MVYSPSGSLRWTRNYPSNPSRPDACHFPLGQSKFGHLLAEELFAGSRPPRQGGGSSHEFSPPRLEKFQKNFEKRMRFVSQIRPRLRSIPWTWTSRPPFAMAMKSLQCPPQKPYSQRMPSVLGQIGKVLCPPADDGTRSYYSPASMQHIACKCSSSYWAAEINNQSARHMGYGIFVFLSKIHSKYLQCFRSN